MTENVTESVPNTRVSGPSVIRELYVLKQVYDAAKARARRAGQPLSAVAREIIWQASIHARPAPDNVKMHTNNRKPGAKTKRVRLTVPQHAYDVAVVRIRASGSSVAAALEDGLTEYARYGTYIAEDKTNAATHTRKG